MRHLDTDDALVRRLVAMDAARTEFDARRALRDEETAMVARRFGEAIALRDEARPAEGYVNRVVGFGPRDLGRLEEIVAFYAEAEIPCQLDLTPDRLTPALMARARALGFAHQGLMTILHGVPEPMPPAPDAPRIDRVTEATYDAAVDIQAANRGRPIDAAVREKRRAWHVGRDDYALYLAWIDGAPAAVVSLFVRDGTAHLGGAVTLPAHRRRGCQTALIRHAIDEAARRGCTLATTDVHFGTSSHRNAERIGMRIAYQTAWWARPAQS